MDPRVQREVINAYDRRGKGNDDEPFVDHTRNGAYLRIDKTTGQVSQISQEEYNHSNLPTYDDGLPVDAGQEQDDSDDDS